MKTIFFHWLVWNFIVSLTMFLPGARAKDIDLSLTFSLGYDRGAWGSGYAVSPTGTHRDNWLGFGPTMQVKYHGWIFNKIQPTIEGGYREEKFNFQTHEAYLQRGEPKSWHVLGGATVDLGKDYSVYLLGGVTRVNYNISIHSESHPIRVKNMKNEDTLLTFKIGAYKTWDVWKLKVGPEVGLEIFPKAPAFSRCRNFEMNRLVPFFGGRVQW